MTDQTSSNPKSWEMTTLADVADVNNLTIDRNYAFDEIEYIDVASVEERNLTETQKLKLKKAPSRAKRIVSDNSILISTVRPNLKHYCFVRIAKPNLVASTGFAVVNAKKGKSDPYFLYNLLTTKEYTDYLIKIADSQTSTYPAFNPSIIQNSKFVLPSFPEQRAIAGVLSSLDDKIELLREQNKTLEAITQAIFKEWFVVFNFPGATGKMIDSELGEIPEGWKVAKIKDFGDIVCGKTPPKENSEYFGGRISFIKIPDMHNELYIVKTEDKLSKEGANFQKNKFIPKNSICVSCIATVGLVSITSEDSQTNQQINSIIPDDDNYIEYLYFSLINMKNDLLAIGSGGSATLNINTGIFSNIEIMHPANKLLEIFHSTARPIFEKILSNSIQIQTLSNIRNTLLPKLMRGEIRVSSFLN